MTRALAVLCVVLGVISLACAPVTMDGGDPATAVVFVAAAIGFFCVADALWVVVRRDGLR